MIGILQKRIENIPCLIIEQTEKSKQPLPLIVYFHGFTSAKEHSLPLAYLLAESGYRVVLPDSHLHGEREGQITSIERQLAFWDIVMKNVQELNVIADYYKNENLLLDGQLGVGGTSMGGITTAASLATYPWIKTAAILMGTPALTKFAEQVSQAAINHHQLHVPVEDLQALYDSLDAYDLAKHPEKLDQRPLLFWHGDSDPVVPYEQSHQFYESAKSKNYGKHLKFISEKNRGHKVSRHAILETVKWFKNHL